MLTKNLKQWKEKITKKLVEEWLLTLSTVGLIASSLYQPVEGTSLGC
ncbi:MAG: hypothetical protein ABGX24_03150 [Aquificota bacterium]|jgi:hypothetical protein